MGALQNFVTKTIISCLLISLIDASSPYNDLISSHIPEKSDSSDVGTNSDYEEVIKLLRFIYFSRVSYLSGSDNNAILTEFPGAIIETTAKTNTRYFIHSDHKEKQIILAIRGSNNIKKLVIESQRLDER